MCFVSFIPLVKGFLVGHNRDEHRGRKSALAPQILENSNGRVAMPIDGKAGGTWIALRSDGVALVLLNGAFENHKRESSYRHSRGVIIPQIIEANNPNIAFANFPLDKIEPFTLIAVTDEITEWRWDGRIKSRAKPDALIPHCWSSVTLYNEAQQAIRLRWFMDALNSGLITDAESLQRWQSTNGYGPKETDIMLERADGIGTVSTTTISVTENGSRLIYEDYLSGLGGQVFLHPYVESLQV